MQRHAAIANKCSHRPGAGQRRAGPRSGTAKELTMPQHQLKQDVVTWAHPMNHKACPYNDKEGEPMRMRLKGNRWYAAFRWKGQWRGDSLEAFAHQTMKAQVNLGRLIERLERGDDPKISKKPIASAHKLYLDRIQHRSQSVKLRSTSILKLHIIPFFGATPFEKVTPDRVAHYKEQREASGTTQSTLEKELRVLKEVMRLAIKDWELPTARESVRMVFKNPGKTPQQVLQLEDLKHAAPWVPKQSAKYGEQYLKAFWFMAFTGLDASDVLKITPGHIKNGWIEGKRGKNNKPYFIYISRSLHGLIESMPSPLTEDQPYLTGIKSNPLCKAIKRAFVKAGLNWANTKSLRHFFASYLHNAGLPKQVIAEAVGHAENSKCTPVYLHLYKDNLKAAFEVFDQTVDPMPPLKNEKE